MDEDFEDLEKREAEVRVQRIQEVRVTVRSFLTQVVSNLCIPEGLSGKVDMAFKINRRKLIAETMIELGKEMLEEENG